MMKQTSTQNDYKFASLSDMDLNKLRETEQKLNTEAGKEIIILAYSKD